MTYSPLPPVVVWRVRPVCSFVTMTFTPDMTAPVASRTVPVSWAVAVWADDVAGMLTNAASNAPANIRSGVRLMIEPPFRLALMRLDS